MSVSTSFDHRIHPHERFFENLELDCDEADIDLRSQAAELLSERTYASDDGEVRVRFD